MKAVVALTMCAAVTGWEARLALAYEGGSTVVDGGTAPHPDKLSRGTWAALLAGYIALGALATGSAYVLRDSLVGRTVAVTAAGWGGLAVGAGAGYGLIRLRGCQTGDCTGEEEVATAVGGLVGSLAATLAAHLLTSRPGMSRPYTAAAGLAPALIFLTVGTIAEW